MPEFPPKKICLVRISALGDTVHALALANGLKKGFPNASLTWILQPLPYEMVKHQPNIDEFVVFKRNAGLYAWRELRDRLKNERFDIAVIPQVSFRSSFISALVRADIKLGFDFRRSRELSWLFTNRHIPHRKPGHVQDQFFEFLDYLGVRDYQKEWNFVFTAEELKWQKEFFHRINRPVISFVIATSHAGKDWPPEHYSRTMDLVKSKHGFQPMIIGGPSLQEEKIAAEIARRCRSNPVIALEKPIRKTLLQLSGSRLVVSPDTGPLHAAVALGTPTVGLYGFSDPRRCGPYGKFKELLIDKYNNPSQTDEPIRRKTKKGGMEKITPDEVMEKIELGIRRYGKEVMGDR